MTQVFHRPFCGFSKQDYSTMFLLDDLDFTGMHVIDCMGALNNFVFELHAEHLKIHCVDPLYNLSLDEIKKHIGQVQQNDVIDNCLNIIDKNLHVNRRLNGSLPKFDFEDKAYDLALCSHYLFTLSDVLSTQFHIQAIEELVRVADEVRIFPLLDKSGKLSDHLGPTLKALQERGLSTEIHEVDFQLQKGGNAMLIVDTKDCEIAAHHRADEE